MGWLQTLASNPTQVLPFTAPHSPPDAVVVKRKFVHSVSVLRIAVRQAHTKIRAKPFPGLGAELKVGL